MKPELSIIIITLNEEEWLPRLLQSIKNQSYKNYEIIVADYHSTDKTRKIAKKQGCKIVEGGKWSKGRNNGAEKSKGKFLLFLDADSILCKGFLEENMKSFKDSKCGTGTVSVKPCSDKLFDKLFFNLYDVWSNLMKKISPHCAGCGIFSRKEVFSKVGGFDEKINFAENHDFTKRAKRFGFKILPKYMYTSVRRLDEEGRARFVLKYVYAGLYRILSNREFKKNLYCQIRGENETRI